MLREVTGFWAVLWHIYQINDNVNYVYEYEWLKWNILKSNRERKTKERDYM